MTRGSPHSPDHAQSRETHSHDGATPHDAHSDKPNERSGFWGAVRHIVKPHSHNHAVAILSAEEAREVGIRAAWISLAGMMATAAIQAIVVALSGSLSLLADTLHNFGHLVTTIPLIVAFRIGRRPPNKRYSYGYRRAEDLAGLFIALVIALSAVLIIRESVLGLVSPRPITHLGWVLVTGIVGAAGNEIVALYRIRAGRRIGSMALIAEGRHARADGLTSLAVVVGVIGVWMGFPQADAAAGLLIAGMILWILVISTRDVCRRLLDGVDDGLIDAIEESVRTESSVRSIESVRARWLGHRLEVEVAIGIDRTLPIHNGEDIARKVQSLLLERIPHLDRVSVGLYAERSPDYDA